MRVIQENAVFFDARRIEIVGGTTQRHHQRVIRDFALRNQQLALLIAQLGKSNGFRFAIDIHHRTQLKLETVVTGMRQIAQRIHAFVQGTRRDFMQ